jgi:hypothetical protein
MITSAQCLKRYGKPEQEHNMAVFMPVAFSKNTVIPKKIYCNIDLIKPLQKAFSNIDKRGLLDEIYEWNGCFNIRNKKSGSTPSLHSWGLAIDINAKSNGFNKEPTMSKELVQCFKDAGFVWGGDWATQDGMHFQLAEFPVK